MTTPDAGRGGSGGAAMTTDAGLPPRPPPTMTAGWVECGTTRCALETSTCCATLTGGSCVSGGGGCPATGGARRCDGPEDCRIGEICCARAEGTAGIYRSACSNRDGCQGGFAMCHADADCGSGLRCCPVAVTPNVILPFCRVSC